MHSECWRCNTPTIIATLREKLDVGKSLQVKPQLLMQWELVFIFEIHFPITRMKLLDSLTKLPPRTFATRR
jgi:hypothetical protein